IAIYDQDLESLNKLKDELDGSFGHLVNDNAQFEVQLTRFYESRATAGPARRNSESSSSSGDEDEEVDGDDADSGVGLDEAVMNQGDDSTGQRPHGCDANVFNLVTQLRELRWRVVEAEERGRKERQGEERRHAGVLRRLVRANNLAQAAKTQLMHLHSEREGCLGSIPCVVWLRRSQATG
ncbi:unnamed protein product, partial [Meganyctiphanes norvegica]